MQRPLLGRHHTGWLSIATALLWLAAAAGCRTEPDPPTPAPTGPDTTTQREVEPEVEPEMEGPVLPERPAPRIVDVVLSREHEERVRLRQREKFPEATLPNLSGDATTLQSQLGQRLSVIIFWNSQNRRASGALEDLAEAQKEHPSLKLIAVNVGETADAAGAALDDAELGAAREQMAVLLDEERTLFDQVANEPPDATPLRLYLVDDQGTVLWFAVDYTNPTYKELMSAIEYVLGDAPPES